ncbi:unnamed protein product, partial [Rotaria socialis]
MNFKMVNRLQGIVIFRQKKPPQEILNEESVYLGSLMTIMNKTC